MKITDKLEKLPVHSVFHMVEVTCIKTNTMGKIDMKIDCESLAILRENP